MYKIIELNQKEISAYKGKIVQVINSIKRDVVISRDYIGIEVKSRMWILTCLVEVE